MLFDTIAAVATAKGDGGVAIIRISGDKSSIFLSSNYSIYSICAILTV